MRLEGLRWPNALFWMIHPHAIAYRSVHSATKVFSLFGARQQRFANAIQNSGADEVVIPTYEGGLMTGRLIQRYCPVLTKLEERSGRRVPRLAAPHRQPQKSAAKIQLLCLHLLAYVTTITFACASDHGWKCHRGRHWSQEEGGHDACLSTGPSNRNQLR